jgi:hypothetical protein
MESNLAIVLFDLAFVAPPLVVLLGILLLAAPPRASRAADPKMVVRAA